jgi:hypothetical protein
MKEATTIRDVLTHRSGAPQMPPGVTAELMCDWDWMVKQVAAAKPAFPPGTRSAYHSIVYGWQVGEIVRRADPRHRGFGHIVGMELEESDEFLGAVREVLYAPEEMYAHQWRPGDLVIWDNQATQHARGPVPDAQLDPDAGPRSLRRVIVGVKDYAEQMEERASAGTATRS